MQIIQKSNRVINSVALMDLKLKELQLVKNQMSELEIPSQNNSNLKDDPNIKDKLDEIIAHTSAPNSEVDVALKGMCSLISKIEKFVESVTDKKPQENSSNKLDLSELNIQKRNNQDIDIDDTLVAGK